MITINIINNKYLLPSFTGQEYMVADSVGNETRKEEEEVGFNPEELIDLNM